MLTSLFIEKPKLKSGFARLLGKLRRDKIDTNIKQAGGISIRCVKYTAYSDKINYLRLDKIIGAQRNRILCNENVVLPKELGYKRFEDNGYKERLCTNLAVSLLKTYKENHLSVGIIDTEAHFSTLSEEVLRYTDDVIVATKRYDIYKGVSQQVIEENGAVMRISKSYSSLKNCDLIIAPQWVDDLFVEKDNTIILTTQKPNKKVGGVVIYDYIVKLPKMLADLCPEGISETYFGSALYSCLGVYELGSLIPRLCISDNVVHTPFSLKTLLLKRK